MLRVLYIEAMHGLKYRDKGGKYQSIPSVTPKKHVVSRDVAEEFSGLRKPKPHKIRKAFTKRSATILDPLCESLRS